MYWSAAWVDSVSTEDLAVGLIHESMHILLKHFERAETMGAVTPELAQIANLAEDACINEEIRKSRPMPAWVIFPETLEQPLALVMEHRYELLRKRQKQQPKAGKVGAGTCGSCSGSKAPGEPTDEKGEGRSDAEMARVRRETAEAVKHAAQGDQGRGTIPDSLLRWADEELAPPKIDWRKRLGQVVRATIAYRPGAVDFDWTKRSRRQAGLGSGIGKPVLPAFRAPVPRVAVVVDTSGSMGSDQLTDAASELNGILQAVGAQVTVCACDAAVHELQEVGTIQAAVKLLKGGGGTDMRPALDALAKHKARPEVVIVATDGYIGDIGPKPSYRVVWLIVGRLTTFMPAWGEVVFVNDDVVAP